jgi:hypothetical protein
MSCSYMTSALVAGTEKMNILRMVLGVKATIALVCDLKQHSCNMARTPKFKCRHNSVKSNSYTGSANAETTVSPEDPKMSTLWWDSLLFDSSPTSLNYFIT